MKSIVKFYKPHIFSIILMLLLLFGQAMADLALPAYMSKIIDEGIVAGNLSLIFKTGMQMLLLSLGSISCAVLVGFFAARIAAKVSKGIRSSIFTKVTEFANPEFDAFSTASLITRSTNDVQQVQMVSVMALRLIFLAPIMGIGALIRTWHTSPSLTWTIALAIGLILIMMLIVFSITMPRFKLAQKLVDKLNLIVNERLTGILVIRAFRTEELAQGRFEEANRDLTKLNLFINRTMSLMMPIMFFVMNGVSVLIIWAGTQIIDMGGMQIGDMMAFIQYTMQIIMAFLMLSMVFIMLPRALVSIQRIAEVIDTPVSIVDVPAEKQKHLSKTSEAVVEFDNVTFRYPDADEDVICNISFTAKPGETTAFIGGTGSGKSTVVNLLPRFYDATEGEIRINGVNINDVPQHELRDMIGYVPQKSVLFSGTIESNIRYGSDDASEEDVRHAAEIAQAKDFIENKPDKYNEPVAQGGTNISGGQKQRLAIARALAKKPPIFIFDDSFSALDFKTDAALRKALSEDAAASTVLIVAQRINTIKTADQIVVLHDGCIEGIGTHSQLMDSCEVYREIALSQLSQEELS